MIRMELDGAPVTTAQLAALGLVGYGHFTSMRVEHGAVRGLSLHLDRLRRDCREVFATDLDTDRVRDLVRAALPSGGDPVVVRVTLYDPALGLAHPGTVAQPRVLVGLRSAPPASHAPITLQPRVFRRELAHIKHVGLFASLHHRALAQRAGFDDALFTEPDGTISEATTSNIAFVGSDGHLTWPDAHVLLGTTKQLIDLAHGSGVRTEKVTLARLDEFATTVVTNAAAGVRAVSAIGDTTLPIDPGSIARLRRDYEAIPLQRI